MADQKAEIMLDVLSGPMTGITTTIAGFSQLTYVMEHFSQNANRLLGGLEGPLMAAGALAVTVAGKFAQMYGEYERGMKIIGAISGQTQAEVDKLGKTAKDFSVKYKMGLDQMNDGLNTLVRAGLRNATSQTEVLKNGLQLAKLEGMELSKALEGVIQTTSLLGGDMDSRHFGRQAKDVSSLLLATSMSSSLKAQDVMNTLKYSGGVAALGGANIEAENKRLLHDYMGIIAEFGAKGVSGDMAGTALRAFLTKPASQDKQVVEGLQAIGLTPESLWEDGGDKMLPISEQLRKIKAHMKDLSKFEQIDIWGKIVGPKMGQQMMKIDPINVKKKVNEIESNLDMENIFKGSIDNFASSMESVGKQAEVNMVNIGERVAFFLKPAVDLAQQLLQFLDSPVVSTLAIVTGFVMIKNGIKAAWEFAKVLKGTLTDVAKSKLNLDTSGLSQGKNILEQINAAKKAGIITSEQALQAQKALNAETKKEGDLRRKNTKEQQFSNKSITIGTDKDTYNKKLLQPMFDRGINYDDRLKDPRFMRGFFSKSSPGEDYSKQMQTLTYPQLAKMLNQGTIKPKDIKGLEKNYPGIFKEVAALQKQMLNDKKGEANESKKITDNKRDEAKESKKVVDSKKEEVKESKKAVNSAKEFVNIHQKAINSKAFSSFVTPNALPNQDALTKMYTKQFLQRPGGTDAWLRNYQKSGIQSDNLNDAQNRSKIANDEMARQKATMSFAKSLNDNSKHLNESSKNVKYLGEASYKSAMQIRGSGGAQGRWNQSIKGRIGNTGFAQGLRQGFSTEQFMSDLPFLMGGYDNFDLSSTNTAYNQRRYGLSNKEAGKFEKISSGINGDIAMFNDGTAKRVKPKTSKLSATGAALGKGLGGVISSMGIAGVAMAGVQIAMEIYNKALQDYQQTTLKAKDKLVEAKGKYDESIEAIKSSGQDSDVARRQVLEYNKGNIKFDDLSENEKQLAANTVALREATQAYKASLYNANFDMEGWNTKLSTQSTKFGGNEWLFYTGGFVGKFFADIVNGYDRAADATGDYFKSVEGTLKMRTTDPSRQRGLSYESQLAESFVSTDLPSVLGQTTWNVIDKESKEYLMKFADAMHGYSAGVIAILETHKASLDDIVKKAEDMREAGASIEDIETAVRESAELIALEAGENPTQVMRALFLNMLSVYQQTAQQVMTELETQIMQNAEYFTAQTMYNEMKGGLDMDYQTLHMQALEIISGQLAQQIALQTIIAQQAIIENMKETSMTDEHGNVINKPWWEGGGTKKYFEGVSTGDVLYSAYTGKGALNEKGIGLAQNELWPLLGGHMKTLIEGSGKEFNYDKNQAWDIMMGKNSSVKGGMNIAVDKLAKWSFPYIKDILADKNMAQSLKGEGMPKAGSGGGGDKKKDDGSGRIWANLAICKKKMIPNLNVNLFKKPPSFLINNKNLKIGDIKVNTEDKPKYITNAVKNAVIDIQNATNPKIIQDENGIYDPVGATPGTNVPGGNTEVK
jgi:hypothetical protein